MFPRPTIESFDAWPRARCGSTPSLWADLRSRPSASRIGRLATSTSSFLSAAHLRAERIELADDWFNNGPMQLADVLPEGWKNRVRMALTGTSLTLTALGRANPMWPDHVRATLDDLRGRLGHGV